MIATLYLFGCVLAPAQAPARPAPASTVVPRSGDWQLLPRLVKAQELLYRGSFSEEATGGRVQFNRSYRLESRIFVLDTLPKGAEVAFFTTLRTRESQRPAPGSTGINSEPVSTSARLELARVDLKGKVLADPGVRLAVPLEGAPTLETGAFLEVPHGRVRLDQSWDVPEEGRPIQTWHVVGTDMVNGTSCLKLAGVQQSEDWDQPRADRTAWRRLDTVWLAPRLGVAYRVERVIERRDPAHRNPTYKNSLRYELESTLQYPGQLFEERRQEINQARTLGNAATPLVASPARHAQQLASLLTKLNYHLEHEPPTPYREALLQVKQRIEAARRGEAPPPNPVEEPPGVPTVVALGQAAPDFLAPDYAGKESARLKRWLGHPVLLVFFNPQSPTTPDVLRYAQRLSTTYSQALTVVALAVADEPRHVERLRSDLGLTITLLNGSGLRVSYALETTPKIVLVDGAGVVRGSYLGWGQETPVDVVEELRNWLSPKK